LKESTKYTKLQSYNFEDVKRHAYFLSREIENIILIKTAGCMSFKCLKLIMQFQFSGKSEKQAFSLFEMPN